MVSVNTPPTSAAHLDVHGVTVALRGDDPELLRLVALDFAAFAAEAPAEPARVAIRCHREAPPLDRLPPGRPVLHRPGVRIYGRGAERWVDYQGRALARWRFDEERGELWGEDPDLLHELLYLMVHARVGALLDARGLHRVHALGLEVGGRAQLLLLPSGGGKTTLALAALSLPGVRLLSDDLVLVDRRGTVRPFPLRLGCLERPGGFEDRHLRRFRRRRHGDKWLLDLAALEGRVAREAVAPGSLLLGRRRSSGAASLRWVPSTTAAPWLGRDLVLGLGLPQIVELFLRLDAPDVARKAGWAASRSVAGAALAARSRVGLLRLGPERAANQALFLDHLRAQGAG